ncbi:hypothetical protein BDN70DRAFT_654870 [Pholiota conissans]|uniref:Carboxylesterase type B domain-containing protein n=1 Tax=Pholiota conissans TaxID=109636 RepID=A0A9P5Z212_9AGAR|nr:hypothetical protein BDN70DRAFT_654870 [Pholiota conissans]
MMRLRIPRILRTVFLKYVLNLQSKYLDRSFVNDESHWSLVFLFLELWAIKKKLPVIFWIHGGGYVMGSAARFTGNDILRESGSGVVLVVIQYRLGLFGFLPGQK